MKIPDERPYEKKIDGVWYNIDSADVGESEFYKSKLC